MKALLRLRTLVILASLVLAVGAVLAAQAVAQSGFNEQPVKEAEGDTVSAADLATPAKDFYGVVNANGTLARGRGAVSATHVGTGAYIVNFDRKVIKCAYVGTIGLSGDVLTSPPGEITVVRANGNEKGVFVTTH